MLTGPCHLARGERVLVVLPKLPEWWLLNIASARAGNITTIMYAYYSSTMLLVACLMHYNSATEEQTRRLQFTQNMSHRQNVRRQIRSDIKSFVKQDNAQVCPMPCVSNT